MPIFGWANDWKDLRFQSVYTNDNTSGDSGSGGATGTGLPVVSGYIWVYVGISVLFFILTFVPFGLVVFWRANSNKKSAKCRIRDLMATARDRFLQTVARRDTIQHSNTNSSGKTLSGIV